MGSRTLKVVKFGCQNSRAPSTTRSRPSASNRTRSARQTMEQLPEELLVKLFAYLSRADLLAVARCSHRCFSIATDPSLWRSLKLPNSSRPQSVPVRVVNGFCLSFYVFVWFFRFFKKNRGPDVTDCERAVPLPPLDAAWLARSHPHSPLASAKQTNQTHPPIAL